MIHSSKPPYQITQNTSFSFNFQILWKSKLREQEWHHHQRKKKKKVWQATRLSQSMTQSRATPQSVLTIAICPCLWATSHEQPLNPHSATRGKGHLLRVCQQLRPSSNHICIETMSNVCQLFHIMLCSAKRDGFPRKKERFYNSSEVNFCEVS